VLGTVRSAPRAISSIFWLNDALKNPQIMTSVGSVAPATNRQMPSRDVT